MKKLIMTFMFFLAGTALAQPVHLATSDDGEVWVGYPESFSTNKDGFFMMVGHRVPGKQEQRSFIGVTVMTCKLGFGSLYMRSNPNAEWEQIGNITISNIITIGDQLAGILCTAGTAQTPKSKSKTNT